jgi:hypothetical protein
MLTPLPPSDVLIHLLLSKISSVGGVWIFSAVVYSWNVNKGGSPKVSQIGGGYNMIFWKF